MWDQTIFELIERHGTTCAIKSVVLEMTAISLAFGCFAKFFPNLEEIGMRPMAVNMLSDDVPAILECSRICPLHSICANGWEEKVSEQGCNVLRALVNSGSVKIFAANLKPGAFVQFAALVSQLDYLLLHEVNEFDLLAIGKLAHLTELRIAACKRNLSVRALQGIHGRVQVYVETFDPQTRMLQDLFDSRHSSKVEELECTLALFNDL